VYINLEVAPSTIITSCLRLPVIWEARVLATITIDNVEYVSEQLSESAKAQLLNLQATDAEIQRLNIQLAIAQTARNAYARALTEALPKTTN
jgi:hypothetical protein